MTTVPPEKLGNLHQLSPIELHDLLRRQENLLENKVFVRRLPDKGAKISALADRIREVIRAQEDVDRTADLFEKLSMDAETSRKAQSVGEDMRQEEEMELLGAIINREGGEKTVVDERMKETQKITQQPKGTNVWRNDPCEDRFIPHKTVHVKSISQLNPQDIDRLKESKSQSEETESQIKDDPKPTLPKKLTLREQADTNKGVFPKLKYRYDESLEADMVQGSKRHDTSKLIPIDEGIRLQEEQKKKYEEMRTQQAMERLAQGLNIKIGQFDAEGGRKMEYRVKEDEDSDDEPE